MINTAHPDDAHADIGSHDAFVNGVPHATFERLRREEPVAWFDEAQGSGFWAITRHADIVAVNRNYQAFTSAQGIRLEEMADDEAQARRSMMERDPPAHTRLRHLVNRGFARRVIETCEPQIRALAVEVIENALKRTEFDFVTEVAKALPMRMLGRLLGTPEEDDEWLVAKADEMIANSDPDFTDHVIDQVDTDAYRLLPFRSPAGQELFDYAERQAAVRRNRDGDDVLSVLLQPGEDGVPLTDLEFKNLFALLASAGNDTTRYSIAASMHLLANNPTLFEQLRDADATLWNTAIEELLRWASPTMHFRRTATQDTLLHDTTIRTGDKIVLWFVSGNYDAAVFDDPATIDLRRKPNPHMAFGRGGPHACLGMWLARLELRLVLQEFLNRVQRVQQAGPHAHLRSNFINGIKRLPVTVERC